jgi:hypothetical protein
MPRPVILKMGMMKKSRLLVEPALRTGAALCKGAPWLP